MVTSGVGRSAGVAADDADEEGAGCVAAADAGEVGCEGDPQPKKRNIGSRRRKTVTKSIVDAMRVPLAAMSNADGLPDAAARTLRDELGPTVEARLGALSLSAQQTLVRNPRSTIEPGRDSGEEARALEAWQAVAATASSTGLSLERTLGEGGMGVVHLAEQVALGRKVAVKTLREGHRDGDAVLKLLREAWITGALEHPNVVPVYDVGVDASGGPLIVLKRIEGVAWSDVVQDDAEIARRFGATDALEWNLRILAQVCNAVHFAHARGVLHRDLKPDNVMIGGFGEVYVLDWGIAVALRDDMGGRFPLAKHADDLAGTPIYMAPEMLGGGASRLSERTDVYLLGAILHEIVAGRAPHEGNSMEAIVSSIVLSEPKLPSHVPEDLARVVRRAMAHDPDERYASAEEVRLAIEGYLRHRGSMRLAEAATRSLSTLRARIADGSQRRVLYNLLGECRFGYRAALVESSRNDEAKHGLRDALLAMAEWELAQHEPESAALLLHELDPAPPELLARVEIAMREKEAERARIAQLERMGQQLDKTPGSLTRTFITAILGVFWVSVPLLRMFDGSRRYETHAMTVFIDVAMLLFVLGLGVWARESMLKTAVNRRLFASLALMFVVQCVLGIGLALDGHIAPSASHWLHVLIWCATMISIAINLERAFAIPAVAAALLFVVAAARPSLLYPGMSLVNVIVVVTAVTLWLPRDVRDRIREARAKD